MAHSYEGKWIIETELPGGGQSNTYIVRRGDSEENLKYVLKRNKNPKRILRFRNEVEALRSLNHANVAKIIDLDLEGEYPWYVQNYFAGGDLEQFVRANPKLDLESAFGIFLQICNGLKNCHDNQIFHRDIKPANIFIDTNASTVVLGDFGLCWIPTNEPRLTQTTERIGSWHFMPPEYRDGRVDVPTASGDIYSLGKVLYYILSGGRSFDREDHRAQQWDIVSLLSNPNPSHPDSLYLEHVNLLLDKMIVHDPEQRIKIEQVSILAATTKRLVLEKFNLIEGKKYAPCGYCGLGYYQPVSETKDRFGVFWGNNNPNTNSSRFRAMICDYCGNVQVFYFHSKPDWILS